MPAMYPEQLRALREQNPGLQYDFRGNVIGVTPPDSVQMAADAIYQMPGVQPDAWSFGPTRADFQNSKDFIGPMQPQWWDPNGELMQQGQDWLGGFMQGRDLQPRYAARQQGPYVRRGAADFGGQMLPPDVRYRQDEMSPGLHADAAGLGTDYMRKPGDINPLGYQPPARQPRPYGSNADELWSKIQQNPGFNPQPSPRGW